MASIRIETGLKTYDIENEEGVIIGQISFNPSDVNIIKRADEASKNIENLLNESKNINFDESKSNEEQFLKLLDDINSSIRKEINYIFDNDSVSDIVFGSQNVLNSLNGKTFVERFLEAFIPIIRKEFEKEQKKSQQRIDNYVKRVK